MNYLPILFAVLLGAISHLQAQQPALRLEADAARFHYDSTRQVWEWYYAFPDTALTYKERDGGYVGEMYCRVIVRDTAGAVVNRQEWIVANTIDKSVTRHRQHLIGVKQFVLPAGVYSVECTVADMLHRNDSLHRSFEIVVPEPVADKLALSDVQLASSIERAEEGGNPAYRKGPMAVIPNPSLLYVMPEDEFDAGVLMPYYVEVYNARTRSPQGFSLEYTVFDAARRPVLTFAKQHTSTADALADYGHIPLDTLSSGVYYFALTLRGTDEGRSDSATTYKKFYVLNPAKPPVLAVLPENQEFEMSEFSTMQAERLAEEFEKIQPLTTAQERETYELLTDIVSRQKFLFRFWKERDPDPSTPENKALQDFRDLVDYADRYYSTMQTRGWRTDRGRVLRQYGKPDKVDLTPYSPEARPHTVWTYYSIQGGVMFCFVNMSGHEEYILVHSTAKNELSEPKWYERYAAILGSTQFHR